MKTISTTITNGVQTVFPVSFALGYIDKAHVFVYTGNVYTEQTGYTWVNETTIETNSVLPSGTTLNIRRVVPKTALINDYTNNAILEEQNLDQSFKQAMMWLEEIEDGFVTNDDAWIIRTTLQMTKDLDMAGNRILNLPAPATPLEPARIQDVKEIITQGTGSLYIGELPPPVPFKGMRWYNPTLPATFVYYMDGTSSQWVEEAYAATNQPLNAYIGETPPPAPTAGTRWYHPGIPATFVYYTDEDSAQWVEEASLGTDGLLREQLGQENSTAQIAGFQVRQLKKFNNLKELLALPNAAMFVAGFYAGTTTGGGWFYFSPTTSKSLHNGGTVIAPEAIELWDGTPENVATLLTWSGIGQGCFIRADDVSQGVDASLFGFRANKSGNNPANIPDVTASLTAAITYCNTLYEEVTNEGYFGATNIQLTLPKGFVKTSAPLPFLRGFDLVSKGTTHFQCATNKGHSMLDCGTGKVLDFYAYGIKHEDYTTCYRMKSDDSDMTQWTFERCGFRNVDVGIDTVNFEVSRSSILTLEKCKVSYGVSRLANSYCDMTHVIGGWYSHNMNSALIVFSGRLCVSGGIYVPVLPVTQNKFCWYEGELADRSSGGTFSGARFGSEFGGGVVLHIKSNDGTSSGDGLSSGNTQAFKFSGCQLSANNTFDPLNTGSTVRGIVVLSTYNNGGVYFDTSTISTDLGPAYSGVDLSRVVAEYNGLGNVAAPNNFAIEFDDSTWRAANNGANRATSNKLSQYVSNSMFSGIYKNISSDGHLNVGITTDGQKNKATFKIKLGAVFTDYTHPILFNLDLGQLGSSSNNAYRNSRFAGYVCSIVGGRDLNISQNVYKLQRSLLYSHKGGTGMNVDAEIISLHFGTGETGPDYIDAAPVEPDGTVDVTVVWGQLANAANTGLARLTPMMNQYSRLLNGNNL